MYRVERCHIKILRYLICHDRPTETDTVLTLQEIIDRETPEVTLPKVEADGVFTLFQTSGSTCVTKAIAHTHKSIIASAHLWTNVIGGMDKIHFNDRYGTCKPFHVAKIVDKP